MNDDRQFAIVIVNYLAYEPLAGCLASLAPGIGSIDVVVIDHQSVAGDLEDLSRRFPWARFVPVANNPGFAAGVNRGMRETTAPYVLLLNPDCTVNNDVARPLGSWLHHQRTAAVCGAIVREADGSIQASARRFPGITTGFAGRTSWLTRVWPGNPWTAKNLLSGVPDGPIEVDWVSGACMMIRREAFAAVGGMDEGFFLYWEDADLCRRLKDAGWLTFYNPSASVTHLTGKSSEHARRASLIAFHRSAYRYYRKHSGTLQRILVPWVFLALQARLTLKLVMQGLLWGDR